MPQYSVGAQEAEVRCEGSVAQVFLERCNGITKELPFSISHWCGALCGPKLG